MIVRTGLGPRLRERVELSDVVQEALVEVVRQFPQFTGQNEAALVGWLRRLVGQKLADLGRYHSRAKRPEGGSRCRSTPRATPGGAAGPGEESGRLLDMLALSQTSPSEAVSRRELHRPPGRRPGRPARARGRGPLALLRREPLVRGDRRARGPEPQVDPGHLGPRAEAPEAIAGRAARGTSEVRRWFTGIDDGDADRPDHQRAISASDRDERLGEAIEAYLALAEQGAGARPRGLRRRGIPTWATTSARRSRAWSWCTGWSARRPARRGSGPGGGPGRNLESGRRIAGYRVVRELGRGGMGTVYEAVHVGLDRPVALKVLGTHAAPDSSARRRFLNEARTAAGLHHTHIVPVFDVGQVGGLCYYAMQRIEGSGLDRVVRHLRRTRLRSRPDQRPLEKMAASPTAATRASASHVSSRFSRLWVRVSAELALAAAPPYSRRQLRCRDLLTATAWPSWKQQRIPRRRPSFQV